MIVVDVEATGMDSRLCSLLSVGAVEFENPANQFYAECFAFPGARIEKEALAVAGFKLEEIATPSGAGRETNAKMADGEVVVAFLDWMRSCREWTLAGQNPSFDRDFLQETAHRRHLNWPLAHRTIDLHSIAYYHMKKRGIEPPLKNNHSALNLDRTLTYVGLLTRSESHHALTDAKLEAEAFGRLFLGKNLLPEFEGFALPKFLA